MRLDRQATSAILRHNKGVTRLAGYDVDEHDADRGAIAAFINQRLAAALWPGQPAVGRMLRLGSYPQPVVIAGVAPNGLYSGYRRQSDPNFLFVSASQAPPPPDEMTLYVRYSGPLDDVVPAISRTLRAVDDRAPIVYLRTMDDQLESLTWPIHALTIPPRAVRGRIAADCDDRSVHGHGVHDAPADSRLRCPLPARASRRANRSDAGTARGMIPEWSAQDSRSDVSDIGERQRTGSRAVDVGETVLLREGRGH